MTIGVKVLKKPPRTVADQAYVPAIAEGVWITTKRFFKNTFTKDASKVTISYPEETREYPERFRGIHRLTHRLDGSPRCVACLCCSTACPAQCIHIEAAEYEPGDAREGYERYPKVFLIDELRCIFCGYCVEACPCDAIRMDTGMHMPASTRREDFLYDRGTLMSFTGRDGSVQTANPRHEPGDASHPGIDRENGH